MDGGRMAIEAVMRLVLREMLGDLRRHGCFSAWHLNNGRCAQFAHEVERRLLAFAWPSDRVETLDDDWIRSERPRDGSGRRRGAPRGMGQHVFLRVDGLFYDAEAPQGVPTPFDLPIAVRAAEAAARGRGRSPETVWLEAPSSRTGPFPAPEPVMAAIAETHAEAAKGHDPEGEAARILAIALADTLDVVRAVARGRGLDAAGTAALAAAALSSHGIEARVVEGDRPADLYDEPRGAWIETEAGVAVDVEFDRSRESRRSVHGGHVLAMPPGHPRRDAYVPDGPAPRPGP